MDKTSQREKTLSLFASPPSDQILREAFTLTLDDDRHVTVDRAHPGQSLPQQAKIEVIAEPKNVLRIRIPSFGDPSFEEDALRALRAHLNARAIIFDLRGNNGGITPSNLLVAIMIAPYPSMIAQTPLHVAMFDARARLGDTDAPLAGASIRLPPSVVKPDHPIFAGRIVVLDDAYCVSACEEFVAALHNARRGLIVGERTYGSTGQPALLRFEDAGIAIAVGAQRESFPDGSPLKALAWHPISSQHRPERPLRPAWTSHSSKRCKAQTSRPSPGPINQRHKQKSFCFFFSRKRRVLFFSEKKNQKTFNSACG